MSPMKYILMPDQRDTQEPSNPTEPKYRFRWEVFVGVPLAIATVLFVLKGIEPTFAIEDLLNALKVVNQNRYIRMMCLMVVCIAILLIVRLLRRKSP